MTLPKRMQAYLTKSVASKNFKELLATKLRAAQAAQPDACNLARR